MYRIPKSFQLGGHTVTVRYVTKAEMAEAVQREYPGDMDEVTGLFVPNELTILLRRPSRRLHKSLVRQTFWHEFAHAMLWAIADKRQDDEAYVDNLSRILDQYHETVT